MDGCTYVAQPEAPDQASVIALGLQSIMCFKDVKKATITW